MAKLKSERHHWWPRCVSRHWASDDGTTCWIKPDGSETRIPSDKLGMIGNGHHIKLGRNPDEVTSWDESFEREFDSADNGFPSTISWLDGLERMPVEYKDLRQRFISTTASDTQLKTLTECVVSLAVRAPMNREASVQLAEKFRGPLGERERNVLIGLNMRRSQRLIADAIGARAKFAVLFSDKKEFIYGDGFFHNVRAVVNRPFSAQILAPITPNISVMISQSAVVNEKRLFTFTLDDDEVRRCNHAVQVYSRNALFYRTDRPEIDEEFRRGEFRQYADPANPIAVLFRALETRDSGMTHTFME